MNRPVERKVYAATIGALSSTVVSDFALWAVDQVWWPSPDKDIPTPVAAFVSAVVVTGTTFLFGWLAKHDPGYVEIDQADNVPEHLPEV